MSELPPSRPPTTSVPPTALQASTQDNNASPFGYCFPYPTTFLRIPYYTNTTFAQFVSTIIPLARSPYRAQVSIPTGPRDDMEVMDIDSPEFTGPVPRHVQTEIKPDGLLLYVAQAIYEPGTSPLSSWVPLAAPVTDEMASMEQSSPLDVFER